MATTHPQAAHYHPRPGAEWRGQYGMTQRRQQSADVPWGLIVAGAAAVGLGIMAWNYFGPDFRRYMKIRSM
jgi:hypothetical protein